MSAFHFNRRSFIRAAGASALSAPFILPASARGANDRIRIGLIGAGKMAMQHLKWFTTQADVEIRAVADVETSRRELAKKVIDDGNVALKRAVGDVSLHLDYQELLAKSDIDAVLIVTPDHWHTAPLIHAASARKDIYCEKPLTLCLDESELCVRAVRKNNIILQTGSQQRTDYNGRFRNAAEYVRSGRIGKIVSVSVHFGATSKTCDLPEEKLEAGLDWDRWLGQAPLRPYNQLLCRRGDPEKYPWLPGWRDYREFSGGQVTDWGCHHLDIVQWALGMDGSGPNQFVPAKGDVSKGGAQLIYKSTPVGDNIVVTHHTYGNGIRFFGTDGELWVSRGELTALPDSKIKEPLTDKDVRFDNVGTSHRRNWLDCIRSRKEPVCKVEIGAGTADVCHLLNIAYWTGKPFTWNPATRTLKGVPASLKGRTQRKGYELPKV